MVMHICNICGRQLEIWDEDNDLSIHKRLGYGSKHDGEQIDLDMCCKCFDRMIAEYILPKCKISPLASD